VTAANGMISSVWLHLQRVEGAVSHEQRHNPLSSCCLCELQNNKQFLPI